MCDQCARLQAENKKLKDLLKLARRIFKKQNEQLDAVRGYTWRITKEFEAISAQGGMVRPEFNRWQGRAETAGAVFKLVYIDWSRSFLETLARMRGL